MSGRQALFLDRDGVINVDHGYVSRPEEFEFIPGIFELCCAARELGYLLVVITNQAGIGRGYYSEIDFCSVTDWMCEIFAKAGARLDGIYFCPHHPEYGVGIYKQDSPFRKPAPGMLLQAAEELGIELGTSALIGDKESDIQAGIAAGVGLNLMFSETPCDNLNVERIVSLLDAIPKLYMLASN